MTKGKCFIILTFILGIARAQLGKPKCITPKSEKGVCIKIHDCRILLALVNQTSDFSNVDFLRKSLCGYKDKIAVVCCPLVQPENTCGKRQIGVIEKILTGENPFQIINGKKAKLGHWPWMASLRIQLTNQNTYYSCGGTLISSQHVLTAAHCVNDKNINLNSSIVILGDLDLDDSVNDKASPLYYTIQSIILHPKFDLILLINDIALLKLEEIVSFTDFIQPICLPIESNIRDTNLTGKLLTVAGWGDTKAELENTALMEVEVPVWSTEKCKQEWSNTNFTINEKVLCAGFKDGGKDSCQGDSGGPLMLKNGNQYFLMGIVSFGFLSCGEPQIPGVYTKVSFYLDWVLETKKKIRVP